MDEVSKDGRNPQRGEKKDEDIFKLMIFILITRTMLEQFNFLIS